MKYLRRLICRFFGHAEPGVIVYPNRNIVIYCPRCLAIICGTPQEPTEVSNA